MWQKSQDEVWMDLERKIKQSKGGKLVGMRGAAMRWVAAASVVLVFGLGGFARFYRITLEALPGNHTELVLPDASKVTLNAASKISYHPYWWKISRTLNLEGEAFFEVQKGRKFVVYSARGTTAVLGTSFNIFARDQAYRVACVTGTVKVSSPKGYEAIIKPGAKAEIGADGKISVTEHLDLSPEISWKKNLFLFTAKPVLDVFREVERQYGVTIDVETGDNSLYTGNFSRDQNVEEVLAYICPAMGYQLVKKSPSGFLIIRSIE